jgi:hypothetical protein
MPLKVIGNLFGINTGNNVYGNSYVNNQARFVQNASNGYANTNLERPEWRGDGVHGENLYCLA